MRAVTVLFFFGLAQGLIPIESHAQSPISNHVVRTEIPSRASLFELFEDGFAPLYDGAPVCCVYVGLNKTNWASFDTNVPELVESRGLRRPNKRYRFYSGPPLSDFVNEHFAIELKGALWNTTNAINTNYSAANVDAKTAKAFERVHLGIRCDGYWLSKVSPIPELISGSPIIGRVLILVHDPQYPVSKFKDFSQSLI